MIALPRLRAVLALALGVVVLPAFAGDTGCATTRDGSVVCPAPDSRCLTDRTGEIVCSTPGGGIEFDRYGDPVCGPGYCTKDQLGDVHCSSAPRGAAANDRYGKAACSVACVPARAQACVKLTPAK